jgi:tetratricopeptide (TPR) repeat protein
LHSFWYLESVKVFTDVAQADPDCAMGYWGIAMSLWYQIWSPPSPASLKRGWEAVEKAKAAPTKTQRERDWVAAVEATVMAAEPDHPGAAHYIIHGYDYPPLARRGLDAARRYDKFAPAVPHALHMPSHIYVLLGMWPETILGNITAAAAEKTRGNPDDHMHALDYLVYAYLQQGQDAEARKVLAEGRAIMADLAARKVESGRPTGHFAIAAMEARWAMERGQWQEAASIEPRPNRFAHTESMIYFARAIGAARTGNAAQARIDADKIAALRDALQQAKNTYSAEQVEIQRRAAAAWVARAEGKNDEALRLMRSAAELEEATEKHSITPGPIATARELCGDLLMDLGQPAQAVREYEASLKLAPARFKALHGAGHAAELAGDRETAKSYYVRLVAGAAPADTQRPELAQAKSFLGSK